jgi:hypothetical protein
LLWLNEYGHCLFIFFSRFPGLLPHPPVFHGILQRKTFPVAESKVAGHVGQAKLGQATAADQQAHAESQREKTKAAEAEQLAKAEAQRAADLEAEMRGKVRNT